MTNYEEMSDFEINKLVAMAEDIDGDIEAITQRGSKLKCLNTPAIIKLKNINETVRFNPCNEASDAWSIILNNKIDIVSPLTNGTDEWQAGKFFIQFSKKDIYVFDKNPLRAAMICFLKLKEQQPCK